MQRPAERSKDIYRREESMGRGRGGGQGVRAPTFWPTMYRLFNIGTKVGPPGTLLFCL